MSNTYTIDQIIAFTNYVLERRGLELKDHTTDADIRNFFGDNVE